MGHLSSRARVGSLGPARNRRWRALGVGIFALFVLLAFGAWGAAGRRGVPDDHVDRIGTGGGLTRAPLPHRFVDRSSGVAVRYPAGWRVDQRALTRLLSPRQLLVVSSFPIRQRRPDPNCTPSTAIKELPPTGVLLFLLEQPSAGNRPSAHFSKRPARFHLEHQAAQGRECFGVTREIDFRSAGRDIYTFAYFGPKASSQGENLADRVLNSLKLKRRVESRKVIT